MPRPDPNISLPVRLAHGLVIVLLVLLTLTGLRLAWWLGKDWLDPSLCSAVDALTPSGAVFDHHALLGTLFGAVGLFYAFYLLFTGEGRRLTNLFHRYEYSFLKKIAYLAFFVLGIAAVLSGFSIYVGLYKGGAGYLFSSLVHQWSFRLIVLFGLLHTAEVLISRRRGVNAMFFGRRFVGFVHWPALLIAAALAVVGAVAFRQFLARPEVLMCREMNQTVSIDGYAMADEWDQADSIVVQTHGGANFTYSAAAVTIKAFRSARDMYVLLRWADDTKSFNRHLMKTDSGWIPMRSAFAGPHGEDIYYEDQAAIYLSRSETCGATCHLAEGSRAGLHYTVGDTADIWVWKAVSTNPTAEADDRYWVHDTGPPAGGRRFDNKASGGYRENLDSLMRRPYFVPTHRIFRDWLLYGAPGYESYDDLADTFSVGSTIPAVLVAPTTGDRGDVKARGVWREGVWTVEFKRALGTGSPLDIKLIGELHLGVAVFDNAERAHAVHLRPIRLIIQ